MGEEIMEEWEQTEYHRGYADGFNDRPYDKKEDIESWYSVGFNIGDSDRIMEQARRK